MQFVIAVAILMAVDELNFYFIPTLKKQFVEWSHNNNDDRAAPCGLLKGKTN